MYSLNFFLVHTPLKWRLALRRRYDYVEKGILRKKKASTKDNGGARGG